MTTIRKQRGSEKVARLPVKIPATERADRLRKPTWIRARFPGTPEVMRLKRILRRAGLHTVCEEASCPNLGECFGQGTATFMIMGDLCTRRCPFCDVAHGRPESLDADEPEKLAATVAKMGLAYVVVTSVDRDDLRDGGAGHFKACVESIRETTPKVQVEILTPDFRGRLEQAVEILSESPPNIFNHNLETIPRLYRRVRPGADYSHSLKLLQRFSEQCPAVPTKSGLMLGLGETLAEVESVMSDLRMHNVRLLTLGQYLQPSRHHLPVERYVTPSEFEQLATTAESMGFDHAASSPMVRSSYHADEQTSNVSVSP
jgi:lipoic acid synthetase|tara:strand:+ start:7854 stop:8801 length:948 start_codon:yes stop_codon:yes gene_type:complete